MPLKNSLRRSGIGTHLAIAFSLLSIFLTVVLAAIIGFTATAQIKSSIGNSLTELAWQTADKLDRGMYERYREIRLMSQHADLVTHDAAANQKREILDARQRSYGFYAWIGLTNPEGKVMVATKGMLEGADVSQRPWFRNALEGTYVGDVHEAVLLAKLLPSPDSEPKRFVDVAFPYMNKDGNIAGVLGVHLSWQWAREVEHSIFEPIARHRQVESMIVSSDGTVLLGSKELQGKKINTGSFMAAKNNLNGFTLETWPDGRQYLVGYRKSQGYDDYPGLGWMVLVRQNIDTAYDPVRNIQHFVLLSGLGLAILFSLLGLATARRISFPLQQLAGSAEQIQRGEAGKISSGVSSYSEINSLTDSLNALVANLLRKESDLRELNQTLEKRVDERTGELQQALYVVRANEARIQTIIESAQDTFVAVDLHGVINDWNSAAERMFGWTRSEAAGKQLAQLILPERYREAFNAALLSLRETHAADFINRRMESIVVDRNGNELPVEASVGLAGNGSEYFLSVFLHDISERKRVEQMKNEFISTVSHELRTPLTSIRASLSLLADEDASGLPPDTRMLITIAQQSCERLVRLINDMLDLEKMESGKMEFSMKPLQLLPLAHQTLESMASMANEAGVRLELAHYSANATVNGDADRLIQVLVNLLSNAIKFSPKGAKVKVAVRGGQNSVRMSVSDHGRGIPDEFKPRIFEKFAQADATDSRQKGGTGLGLSICKKIVEAHGGQISFESASGQGTVFHVELPIAANAEI